MTSLDSLETNVSANLNSSFPDPTDPEDTYPGAHYPGEFAHWHPEDDPEQAFLHSGWAVDRKRIDAALCRTHASRTRRQHFRDCGSGAWVYENIADATDVRLKGSWCHDRFCRVCGAQRAAHIAGQVKAALGDTKPLFITLTLANTRDGLAASLDRLYRGFRLLRQTDFWKARIQGGVAFLEIKHSAKAGRWHPHLHILADGSFVPQAELSDIWRAITRDSFVVDVRRVAQIREALTYVSKYASKPLSPSFLAVPALIDEALVALAGRRLLTTFGNWRGRIRVSDDGPQEGEETIWLDYRPVKPLYHLLIEKSNGNPAAAELLERLGRRKRPPPQPPDPFTGS